MKKFTNHPEPWGKFVDIKVNAPEMLQSHIKRLRQKSRISLGTVCDVYQPVEEKYQLTRRCLEILKYYHHHISILTKSPLILRDLDILKRIKDIEVGFTITTLDEKIKNFFEPNSPAPEERLKALKIIANEKIPTWVFVAPLLPYLTDKPQSLIELIRGAARAGAMNITFDTLNPYPNVWHNVTEIVKKYFPQLIEDYNNYFINKTLYEKTIKEKISEIGKNFNVVIDFAF